MTNLLGTSARTSQATTVIELPTTHKRSAGKDIVPWLLLASLIWATTTVWVRVEWIPGLSAIGIWAALGVAGYGMGRRSARLMKAPSVWLMALLPLWGLLQIALGWSESESATVGGTLHWALLAAIFASAYVSVAAESAVDRVLDVCVAFASTLAVLCILQLDTSAGKLLWLFDTGYTDRVFATFPYHNNYAQLMELALPVCLWRGLTRFKRRWIYFLLSGLMMASVLAAGSRAGVALIALETMLLLGTHFQTVRRGRTRLIVTLGAMLAFAVAIAGSHRFLERLDERDPLSLRPPLALATWDMASKRVMRGWGLGTFPRVYPSFARIDVGKFVNHAHNDWLECLAEGGLPFAVSLALVFVLAAPALWRRRWPVGVLAVGVHAAVDYPFARIAVAGWLFLLLALALAEDASSRTRHAI